MASLVQPNLTFGDRNQGISSAISSGARVKMLAAARRLKIAPPEVKLPKECLVLPAGLQVELKKFLEEIRDTEFLQERHHSFVRQEWNVSAGPTWEEAYRWAKRAYNDTYRTWKKGILTRRRLVDKTEGMLEIMSNVAEKNGRKAAFLAAHNAGLRIALANWRADAGKRLLKRADDPTGEDGLRAGFVADAIAGFIVVSDLDFPRKAEYLAKIRAQWEVLRVGYGFIRELGGILFVYTKTEIPKHGDM